MLKVFFLSLIFFFHTVLCISVYGQESKEKSIPILEKPINETFNNVSAQEALKIISEKAQVIFCYNSTNLPVDYLVNLNLKNTTLGEALILIFKPSDILLTHLGDHVVIKKAKNVLLGNDSAGVYKHLEAKFIESARTDSVKSRKEHKLSKEYKRYLTSNYDIIFREDITSDSLAERFAREITAKQYNKIYVPKVSRQKWFVQIAFQKPIIDASLAFADDVFPPTSVRIISQYYQLQSNFGGELAFGYFFTKKISANLGFGYWMANQKLVAIDYSTTYSQTAPQRFNLEVKAQDVKTAIYNIPLELGYTYKPKRLGVSALVGVNLFFALSSIGNYKPLYTEYNRFPNEQFLHQNPNWFFQSPPPTGSEFTKPIYNYEQKLATNINVAVMGGLILRYSVSRRISLFVNGKGYYLFNSYSATPGLNINLQMWSMGIGLQYSW